MAIVVCVGDKRPSVVTWVQLFLFVFFEVSKLFIGFHQQVKRRSEVIALEG